MPSRAAIHFTVTNVSARNAPRPFAPSSAPTTPCETPPPPGTTRAGSPGKGWDNVRNYGVYEEGGAGKRLLFQFHVAGNTRSLYSVSGLELNRWYQVTCTYDGSMMRLYLNGALDNPGAASGTPLVSTDALTFGYAGYFTYAQASLADVRLYNRVLSATEIAGLTPQLKRRYTYGHDLISVTELPSTLNPQLSTHYYGYDGHGSVRFLTDSDSGAATDITDTYDYDAYGQLLAQTYTGSGPTMNHYRYTGEQWDADLGMYYLRARYLNPNTGLIEAHRAKRWYAPTFGEVKAGYVTLRPARRQDAKRCVSRACAGQSVAASPHQRGLAPIERQPARPHAGNFTASDHFITSSTFSR